eukprot:861563-Rhodomonas_salina.1
MSRVSHVMSRESGLRFCQCQWCQSRASECLKLCPSPSRRGCGGTPDSSIMTHVMSRRPRSRRGSRRGSRRRRARALAAGEPAPGAR